MADALGFLALGLGLVVIVVLAARRRDLAAPLLAGFLARSVLALIDETVIRLPGQDDSFRFDHFAYYWARNGLAGTMEHLGTGAELYTWFISVFYAVLDRSRLMMQAVNVLFGSLIILNVAGLARTLAGSNRAAVTAAWLVALFPSLVFFSAVLLREVAVAYPLTLAMLLFARWYADRRPVQVVGALVAVAVSMAFHSGAGAVFLAGGVWLVALWLREIVTGRFRHLGRNTVALVVGAAIIGVVLSSGFGLDKFQYVSTGDLKELTRAQENYATGRAVYLEDLHPDSNLDLAWQTPIRLLYFLFAPFPWMLRGPADLIGFVDSLFFLGLFREVWRARAVLAERRDILLVLGAFVALATTFAIGVSNYGTAHRHRNKMLPLLIGAAVALRETRRARGAVSPKGEGLTAPPSRARSTGQLESP